MSFEKRNNGTKALLIWDAALGDDDVFRRYLWRLALYIMNEYLLVARLFFRGEQLKCKKEGLCVYAVLKVNLFIAAESRMPLRSSDRRIV